jgi:hypothetical protein
VLLGRITAPVWPAENNGVQISKEESPEPHDLPTIRRLEQSELLQGIAGWKIPRLLGI